MAWRDMFKSHGRCKAGNARCGDCMAFDGGKGRFAARCILNESEVGDDRHWSTSSIGCGLFSPKGQGDCKDAGETQSSYKADRSGQLAFF